jgi:hypothetical protein
VTERSCEPRTSKNSIADEFKGHKVSYSKCWNWKSSGRELYFAHFLSAVLPGCEVYVVTSNSATVSMTVTSHASALLPDNGAMVTRAVFLHHDVIGRRRGDLSPMENLPCRRTAQQDH